MKIHWNQNPFHTTVEIDDYDKEVILTSYQKEELENIFFELQLGVLSQDNEFIVTNLKKVDDIVDMDIDDEQVQKVYRFLDSPHCGDCINISCGCVRCFAENMLHITTLPSNPPLMKMYFDSYHKIDKVLDELGKEPDLLYMYDWLKDYKKRNNL